MDKLNIENLFNCKTARYDKSNTIDIISIAGKHSNERFNIKQLIDSRENKRKEVLKNYKKMYNICLKKIDVANKLNKTDLLYTVEEFIPNCPEYNTLDCIKFIQNKLNNFHMDTYEINNKTIFITWYYIELNKYNSNNT